MVSNFLNGCKAVNKSPAMSCCATEQTGCYGTWMRLGTQNPGLTVNLQMKEAAPYKLSFPGGIALLKLAVLY